MSSYIKFYYILFTNSFSTILFSICTNKTLKLYFNFLLRYNIKKMGYKTLYFVAIASGAMAKSVGEPLQNMNLENLNTLMAMLTGTYGSEGIVRFRKLCPIYGKFLFFFKVNLE